MSPDPTVADEVDTLVATVKELLRSSDPRDRVRAVHHLAAGAGFLERQVLHDAQASGVTWAEIGHIYGVSRQAVHRKFASETVVPADFFDDLLEDLDSDPEVAPALARAAQRAQRVSKPR
jgi:hypothetical protein